MNLRKFRAALLLAGMLAAPVFASTAARADMGAIQLAQDDTKAELDYWNSIKDSKKAEDYQNYLDKYPNGQFVDLAKLRLKRYAPAPAAAPAPAPAAAPDPQQVELADWNAVKNSKSAADYEAFLKKHPDGDFAELAKLRIQNLKGAEQPAAAAPASAAPAGEPPVGNAPAAPAPAPAPAAQAPATPMPEFDNTTAQLYAKSGARVRATPTKTGAVLAKLQTNTEVTATGKSADGAWWRIAMAGGGTGYLAASAAGSSPVAIAAPAPSKPKTEAAAAPAAPLGPDEDVCKLDSTAGAADRVAACERLAAKASSDQDKIAALTALAAALDVAQRYDDSVRKYEQAAALAPRDATIYSRLGLVRLDQHRFPEARSAFDKAAMLDSKNPDYVFQRGIAAAGFGDFAKARDEVKRALLSKDTMEYYEKLGEYELALGNLDAVKTALERGRKADPNAKSLTIAVLDYYTGNLDSALSGAKFAANSGESPYAPLWQAIVQKAKGDATGAAATIETARGMVGDDWPAPVFDHLTGKIPESKMVAAAKTSNPGLLAERLCVAKFFAGEWAYLSGQQDAARASLQDATGTQAFYRLEFAAAKGRLAHMSD